LKIGILNSITRQNINVARNLVTTPVQSTFKNMTMLRKYKVSCDAVVDDNG
jgi:hypothetical protein